MSIQYSYLFHLPFSHRRHHISQLFLLVGGLIVILCSVLIGLALVDAADLSYNADMFGIEGQSPDFLIRYLCGLSFVVGLELGVFVAIMRLEFLQSHIGEKLPTGWVVALNNISILARNSKTALHYGAVFCLLSAFILHLENHVPHGVRQSKPSFQGGQ